MSQYYEEYREAKLRLQQKEELERKMSEQVMNPQQQVGVNSAYPSQTQQQVGNILAQHQVVDPLASLMTACKIAMTLFDKIIDDLTKEYKVMDDRVTQCATHMPHKLNVAQLERAVIKAKLDLAREQRSHVRSFADMMTK